MERGNEEDKEEEEMLHHQVIHIYKLLTLVIF